MWYISCDYLIEKKTLMWYNGFGINLALQGLAALSPVYFNYLPTLNHSAKMPFRASIFTCGIILLRYIGSFFRRGIYYV